MKHLAHLYRRLPWLHLPAGILIALLQRTPAVRLFSAASDYVVTSPAGQLLRAAFTLATLGAMHSRAGATTFVTSQALPIQGTVGTPLNFAFTYTGTPSAPQFFNIDGTLPPGLAWVPAASGGVVRSGNPAITGTPTAAGTYVVRIQGVGLAGQGTFEPITFVITGGAAAVAPTITSQPQSVTLNAGANASFTVAASGTPPPTFQWRKNGVAIAGATGSTLTLPSISTADAATYSVVATNASGTATSNDAVLTVVSGNVAAPTIVSQPIGFTAAAGSTAALSVVATGSPAPLVQWRKDGAPVAGANAPTLILNNVTAADAGTYTAVFNNPSGSVTSNPAIVSVSSGQGRLANLSVRANLAAAQTLFVGLATSGSKNVLLRGIGPTLTSFGVAGALADPRLELFDGPNKVTESEDWIAGLDARFSAVGAFPLVAGSKDAALETSIAGARTAQIRGPGAGVALVEVYDSGAGSAVRLVNVSARNVVGTGDNILIAGFVVDGTVGKTLLIRAVGPTLAGFGVGGTLVNPKLEIYTTVNNVAVKLLENDDWSTSLRPRFAPVGAFDLLTGSRDAALLVTLPPGSYSAQVSGADGGTGEALVEVYEVP